MVNPVNTNVSAAAHATATPSIIVHNPSSHTPLQNQTNKIAQTIIVETSPSTAELSSFKENINAKDQNPNLSAKTTNIFISTIYSPVIHLSQSDAIVHNVPNVANQQGADSVEQHVDPPKLDTQQIKANDDSVLSDDFDFDSFDNNNSIELQAQSFEIQIQDTATSNNNKIIDVIQVTDEHANQTQNDTIQTKATVEGAEENVAVINEDTAAAVSTTKADKLNLAAKMEIQDRINREVGGAKQIFQERREEKNYRSDHLDKTQANLDKTQLDLDKTQLSLDKTQLSLDKTQAKLDKTQLDMNKTILDMHKNVLSIEKASANLMHASKQVEEKVTLVFVNPHGVQWFESFNSSNFHVQDMLKGVDRQNKDSKDLNAVNVNVAMQRPNVRMGIRTGTDTIAMHDHNDNLGGILNLNDLPPELQGIDLNSLTPEMISGIKLFNARAITEAESEELHSLITNYFMAHAQLVVLQRLQNDTVNTTQLSQQAPIQPQMQFRAGGSNKSEASDDVRDIKRHRAVPSDTALKSLSRNQFILGNEAKLQAIQRKNLEDKKLKEDKGNKEKNAEERKAEDKKFDDNQQDLKTQRLKDQNSKPPLSDLGENGSDLKT